jgi:hypothetical protein
MPIPTFMLERLETPKGSSMNFSTVGLFDDDIPLLVALLNEKPDIRVLNLGTTNIGKEKEGVEALMLLQHVADLTVSFTNIKDDDAIKLISNPRFRWLDLSKCKGITDIAGEYMLQHAHQISLKINDTNITPTLAAKINARIANNLTEHRKHSPFTRKPKSTLSAPVSPSTGIFSNGTHESSQSNGSKTDKITKPPEAGSGDLVK